MARGINKCISTSNLSVIHLPLPRPRRRQVEEVLHRGQSQFQKVEVVKTTPFGRLSSPMVSCKLRGRRVRVPPVARAPALTAHSNPKVFIAGGGEVRTPYTTTQHTKRKRAFVYEFLLCPKVLAFFRSY